MARLTVAQVAELCEVSPATVRSWISRGKIRRHGRGLLDSGEVLAWWDHYRCGVKATRQSSAGQTPVGRVPI